MRKTLFAHHSLFAVFDDARNGFQTAFLRTITFDDGGQPLKVTCRVGCGNGFALKRLSGLKDMWNEVDGMLYEYACQVGSYGLASTLRAEHAAEKAADEQGR